MVMEDVQEDDIFNRENLQRALRFVNLKAFHPVGGCGTIATFEVTLPGLLKIRDCKLRRRAGEPLRLTTGRLDHDGGFAVELRSWLRDAILAGGVAALREKYQKELAALEAVDEAETDALPHVPGIDVAALPAQLMRAVR
jgi:hypothetical protein